MAVIHTHDVHLYACAGDRRVELMPMQDAHLPLLARWNADTEILYWTEGEYLPGMTRSAEEVREIYGSVSQSAHCFMVMADDVPVGECWLQRMNLIDVLARYRGKDVRRIDMMIGEKGYWGQGIGTAIVARLAMFAFEDEGVDALHCVVMDFNRRSQRTFLRNGFAAERVETEVHLVLTREGYEERRANGGYAYSYGSALRAAAERGRGCRPLSDGSPLAKAPGIGHPQRIFTPHTRIHTQP